MRVFFLLCSFLCGLEFLCAQTLELRLNALFESPRYRGVDIAVVVRDLRSGDLIYAKNVDQSYMPASLMKLVLTGTYLDTVRMSYRFKTPVYIDSQTPPTLYIAGVGDPNHQLSDFNKLANTLLKQGIHHLNQVVLDTSAVIPDEDVYEERSQYYYALAAGLNLNFNQIELKLNDSQNSLYVDPASSFSQVNLRKSRILNSNQRGYPLIQLKTYPGYDVYDIRGNVSSLDERYGNLQLRVSRPSYFYNTHLKKVLNSLDIKCDFPTDFRSFHKRGKRKLMTLQSPPVDIYLRQMNQESNNMLASSLLKHLGALRYGFPASSEKGLAVMDQFFSQRLGIDVDHYQFFDGSGLKYGSYVTAAQVDHLLSFLYRQHFSSMNTLLLDIKHSSDYRFIDVPNDVEVRVKSGTLLSRGINNLVGYIYDAKKETAYSFVVMAQQKKSRKALYKGTLTKPVLKDLLAGLSF